MRTIILAVGAALVLAGSGRPLPLEAASSSSSQELLPADLDRLLAFAMAFCSDPGRFHRYCFKILTATEGFGLGTKTRAAVAGIARYNPDASWRPVSSVR